MNKKMMGVFLASLLSLSIVGASYAYWTDVLTITGTVTTGTFHGYLTLQDYYDEEWKEVGCVSAELSATGDDQYNDNDVLTITVNNAYPGYKFCIIWDMHWAGSVPAHVDVDLSELPDWLTARIEITSVDYPVAHRNMLQPDILNLPKFKEMIEWSQWHMGDSIVVKMCFEVIEDDNADPIIDPPQDTTTPFSMYFNFYQYNLDDDPSS